MTQQKTAGSACEPHVRLVQLCPLRRVATSPPQPPTCGLTKHQIVVLHWLSLGKTYNDIAEILGRKPNTVWMHAHRIRDKLGACTTAGAVGIALRKGIIA